MLRRIIPLIALGTALAACSEDTAVGPSPTPATPPPPPPPAEQVRTIDQKPGEGQALPAYIAHRMVNGQLEQVYVDSARLVVTNDGRFQQSLWTRTLRDGAFSHRDNWIDAGAWRLAGQTYVFTSNGGSRQLTVRTATQPVINVTETMVGWPQAGVVIGIYSRRTTPPANQPPPQEPGQPPLTETRFRATDVSGQPLSALVISEKDVPHKDAETYSQLDSAWVALRSNGTYERRAFYSTWYSPNYVFSLGYIRVAFVRDYDRGTYVRASNGTLTLTSDYFQNRTATGVHLGDRIRLTQDMLAGDPVRPNVCFCCGHSIRCAREAGATIAWPSAASFVMPRRDRVAINLSPTCFVGRTATELHSPASRSGRCTRSDATERTMSWQAPPVPAEALRYSCLLRATKRIVSGPCGSTHRTGGRGAFGARSRAL